MVAFWQHDKFSGFKHVVIPVFGLLANLLCMLFFLIGPFYISGMSAKEPYWALAVAGAWGVYGAYYFIMGSKKGNKPIFLAGKTAPAVG